MIYELNHAGMRIRDLAASLHFYVDVLGAKVVDELYIASGRTDRVHIQLAGGLVELLHPHRPPAGATFGIDHIGFMTDDLDGDHARLVDAGFVFSTTPKVAGSGQGRLAFLSDPNGVRVELLQRKEILRVPTIEEGFVRALDHISVAAPDLVAAEAFYRGHLAMAPVPVDAPGRSYSRHGDDVLGLVRGESERPIRGLVLRVDSVAETTERLRSRGVEVDQSGQLRDPDGARVELVDRPLAA